MHIFISNNASALRKTLAEYTVTATVEAEYGDDVVEGTIETLAHHGPRAENLCPCLEPNREALGLEAIGLSHIDLDTLGGVMALQGRKPEALSFWLLAAFVDIHGAHKLANAGATDEDLRRLHAWWEWAEKYAVSPPLNGSTADATVFFNRETFALLRILEGDERLLTAGDEWKATRERLSADSFLGVRGGVATRVAPRFVNDLYVCGDEVARAVVAMNPWNGSITLSLADPIPGVSCVEIARGLWGTEAGGHVGIAGGPRDRVMTLDDLYSARNDMVAAVKQNKRGDH